MAMTPNSLTDQQEYELQDAMVNLYADPLGYVYFAFNWGQGELRDEAGPDVWQEGILSEIGKDCTTLGAALQMAVASGHGVGKTALVSWIILWFISTRPHPQIVVTANTGAQLYTKTWRELAKWQKLAVNGHWFDWQATSFKYKPEASTWFASAIPWSANNSEAFAGTHEQDVLIVMDEASAIDDIIWEVTEGAMTTPGAMWLAFGNPTRNTGRFKECFPGGRFAHRWKTFQVDSRNAKKANRAQIENWITDYGDDSDFVRIRVKGQFPRASSTQFIGEDLIELANGRFKTSDPASWAPRVIGVDVARYGDDASVVLVRQGHRILEKRIYRDKDSIALAGLVTEAVERWEPHATFIDEVGVGAGVVDQCRARGYHVLGVNAGVAATDDKQFRNLRAEMYGKVKDWLAHSGCLDPEDRELSAELTAIEYGFDIGNRLQLEKKEDMKARGLASPDQADALGLTFARPVTKMAQTKRGGTSMRVEVSFDPITYNQQGDRQIEVETEWDVYDR